MSANEPRTELGVYMEAYRDGLMGWGEFTIQVERIAARRSRTISGTIENAR